MLARLWWKEARLFWPLWLCVGLFAAGAQWLFLASGLEEARIGLLTALAMGWTALYAFAVSSAAFAGERETNTLLLLDFLPVSRPMLWRGKAGFALASTFVLAGVLVSLAEAGTGERNSVYFGYAPILVGFGTLLIESVAWGLFWSAIAGNALTAAVLAIVCVGAISAVLSGPNLDLRWAEWLAGRSSGMASREFSLANPIILTATAPMRLGIALVALALSRVLIVRRPRPNPLPRVRLVAGPTEARPRRPRRARFAAVGRLAWKTFREAWIVWSLLGPIGIGLTVLLLKASPERDALTGVCFLVGGVVSLVAGVNVFGPDNRGRTARFYLHHGARPTTVWLVKELIWAASLSAFLVLDLIVATMFGYGGPFWEIGLALLVVANTFFVAQLCGLLIRRGITAGAVGFLATLLLVPPQVVLTRFDFVPWWTGAFVPLILLGISWAWSGEWMLDRSAPSRWVKLGALLVLPFLMLIAGFIIYRAESLPDIGRVFPLSEVASPPIPPEQNAAEVYQQPMRSPGFSARETLSREGNDELERVLKQGWDPDAAPVVRWWRDNQATIATVRRAAAMPRAQFQGIETMTYDTVFPPILQSVGMHHLSRLVALDARERQARGDLAGAWDDIRVLLRMAEQLGQGDVPMMQALMANRIDSRAMSLSMDWVEDPKQTPDLLRAAREGLPPLPTPSKVLKAESTILDHTLRLPADQLRVVLYQAGGLPSSTPTLARAVTQLFLAPSWERQRARRLNRLLTADLLQYIDEEPWQRRGLHVSDRYFTSVIDLRWPPDRPVWRIPAAELEDAQASTHLLRILWPNIHSLTHNIHQELVLRRAFVIRAALRSWQLKHGGKLPESLDELVPSELSQLPLDPYSGQPFRYIVSGERMTVPFLPKGERNQPVPIREGQRLLYSVGYDGIDDGGAGISDTSSRGDFVFPLPEPASP